MSYRIKRIDPYWFQNPILPAAVVICAIVALVLVSRDMAIPALIVAAIGGLAVIAATKPAVSAVMATLGVVGGMVTFVFMPDPQNASLPIYLRLVSTLGFTFLYTVLMDGLVLMIAVLYNLFSGVVGFDGIGLNLEDDGQGD